jgi:hypothetical protein
MYLFTITNSENGDVEDVDFDLDGDLNDPEVQRQLVQAVKEAMEKLKELGDLPSL